MLREAFIRFNPFLTYRHTVIRTGFASSFNNISLILTDIIDKMFAVRIGVTYSVSEGLNICSPILTIFVLKVAYFKRNIPAEFFSYTYIGVLFAYL